MTLSSLRWPFRLLSLLVLFFFVQQQHTPIWAAPAAETAVAKNLTLTVTAPDSAVPWGEQAELIATVTNDDIEPSAKVLINQSDGL